MTTLEEGSFLVKLARQAIIKYVSESVHITPPEPLSPSLALDCGVFVTLEKLKGSGKSLRGCIGYPLPCMPLINATIDAAISAAVNDPRFSPVRKSELNDVVVEVSVMTPPKQLEISDPKEYPRHIKVGRDGLIIEKGYYKGLLLPQVPVEYGWDEETFLSECCMKACLPPDSWVSKDVKVFTFTAEVFTEIRPGGEVERKSMS